MKSPHGASDIAAGQASGEWRQQPLSPRRMALLHPVTLLLAVWIVAGLVWALSPQGVIDLTRSGTRATSSRAFWYILASLATFTLASLAVSLVPGRHRLVHARQARARRLTPPDFTTAKRLLAGAATLGAAVWLARILAMAGGPFGLISYLAGGQSVIDLKSEVTTPAQLPPITTLVHLTPGAVAFLVFLHSRRGWGTEDRIWFAILVGITVIRALIMAERLAVVGTVSAGAITYLATAPRLRVKWLLLGAGAVILLGYGIWTVGEFTRSWQDSRPPGTDTSLTLGNYFSSLSYANVRLGAYFFTAIDNAVITIESWPTQSFPEAVSPPLAATGIFDFAVDAPDLFQTKLNREFTGFTMAGLFFRDAREFGVVFALVYGAFFGLAWRLAASGSPAGIVLYGSTAQIVIDSFRMTYLFDTQGIAAIVAAIAIWLTPLILVSERRRRAGPPADRPGPRALAPSRRKSEPSA